MDTTASEFVGSKRRLRKPRSKFACHNCRQRKVRCDAYPKGSPCTNCRLDRLACVCITEKRRMRQRNQNFDVISSIDLEKNISEADANVSAPEIISMASHSPPDWLYDALRCVKELAQPATTSPEQTATSLPSVDQTDTSEPKSQNLFNMEFNRDKANYETSSIHSLSPAVNRRSRLAEKLPAFLRCDLERISAEDLGYLEANNCFDFPSQDILEDLLRCYFDYVHPQLPMVDEDKFWETFFNRELSNGEEHDTPSSRISALLFQSILFAAATFAPLDTLRRLGFTSRRDARCAFYGRVRALYSLDIESDSMSLLHALLLMSYWRDIVSDEKDAWHWCGLAVELAYGLELDQEPKADIDARQRVLHRRCWWSCVVRDRLLAFSGRKIPRIDIEDCKVAMLTLADYNVSLRSSKSGLSPTDELCERTTLSMFSIQLIKLTLNIGRRNLPGHRNYTTCTLAHSETWARNRQRGYHPPHYQALHHLEAWKSNLPDILEAPLRTLDGIGTTQCILVHCATLHIYYHTIVLSLTIPSLFDPTLTHLVSKHSAVIRESSRAIADLDNALADLELTRYLHNELRQSSRKLDVFQYGMAPMVCREGTGPEIQEPSPISTATDLTPCTQEVFTDGHSPDSFSLEDWLNVADFDCATSIES